MFQIISDGSCDLSPEQLNSSGIFTVPFYVTLDGKTYRKEAAELPVHEFYDYCIRHPECTPKTSMPTVQDYTDSFRRFLDDGKDILCYCISKQLSGSLNSALVAKNLLLKEYPERRILVADSMMATGLQGVFLLELSAYARKGHSLQETFERGEEIKKNAAMFFTLEDLSYLARGGRIGRLTDLAIRNLNLRPLIVFKEGGVRILGVSVGRRKSFERLAEIAGRSLTEQKITLSRYTFGIGWGYDREEANPFFDQIRQIFLKRFGEVPDFVPIQVGATIGVHTGPRPVGFGFLEKALC